MIKAHVFVTDAWRTGQEPEAIADAITLGDYITDLITEAATLIKRACQDVDPIIKTATLRCQMIVDRLIRETDLLGTVLRRLRAADRAVIS
jgi:hypothetical protein